MAYIPPAGNAVNLQITGANYSTPAGNAADLTFVFNPTGVADLTLAFSIAASAVHGTTSAFALTLPISFDVVGEAQFTGRLIAELQMAASATINQDAGGNLHADLNFLAEASGAGQVYAGVAANLSFSANAVVLFESFGGAAISVPVFVVGRGLSSLTGTVESNLLFSASGGAEHIAPITGVMNLTLIPSVASSGATGYLGSVSQPLKFSCHAAGVNGRVGNSAAKVFFSASAAAKVGVVAGMDGYLRFTPDAAVKAVHQVSAELVAELRFVPSIYSPDRLPVVETRPVFVFENVRRVEVVNHGA